MCFRWYFILWALFFGTGKTVAQSVNFIHYNITIEQGLPESTVLAITQDNTGFIWLATPNFLCRYDGSGFKVFSKAFDFNPEPQDVNIGKLYVQGDKLWMITKGGRLEYMDLSTETIYPVVKFGESVENIPALSCMLFDGNNRIYLGTKSKGIFIVDKNFHLIDKFNTEGIQNLSSNRINNLLKDQDDNLLILTDSGINRYRLGIIKQYSIDKNFLAGANLRDGRRTIFGTAGEGIWMNPDFKSTNEFIRHHIPSLQNELHFTLTSVETSGINGITERFPNWFGTLGEGLKVEPRHKNELYDVVLNGNPEHILCLFSAYNSQLWIGTKEHGVYVIDKNIADNFFVPELEYDYSSIRAFYKDGDVFSFASKNGGIHSLNVVSEQPDFFAMHSLETYKSGAELERSVISSVQGTGEYICVDGTAGAFLLNPNTKVLKELSQAFADFVKIKLQSSDKTIFFKSTENSEEVIIGSPVGLFVYDLRTEKAVKLSDISVDRLVELGNFRLAAISDQGLVEYFPNINHSSGPLKVQKFKFSDNVEISAAVFQNDWLWISTLGQGIYAINLQSGKKAHFNDKNGLPNNFIAAMESADTRTIWCSTNNGLFKLHYAIWDQELVLEQIKYFNYKNGLPVNEFKPGLSIKTSDGKICFGGSKKFLCLYLDNHFWQESIAKLVFTDIKVNSQSLEGECAPHLVNDLVLNHDQNSLEFTFSALGTASPEYNQYSYFLEGIDEDWNNFRHGRSVSYSNLLPGKYNFQVKLANNNFPGAPVKQIDIFIQPAFWQTTWFKITTIVSLFFLGYIAYRIRIGQVLRLQKIKDEISADLHDDLGSRLTTIQLLSAIHKNKYKNESEIQDLLTQIEKEVHDSSEALHDLVCNIRMKESEIKDFLAKLRRYFSETLDQANILYKIEFEGDLGSERLGMQKRRDIFFIAKEVLNNIRKHSHAGFVEVIFKKTDRDLYFKIKDNGDGFDLNESSDRNGFKSLKLRVERNKGKFLLNTRPGLGTELQFWIPFDRNHLLENILKSYGNLRNNLTMWT